LQEDFLLKQLVACALQNRLAEDDEDIEEEEEPAEDNKASPSWDNKDRRMSES